MLMLKFKTKRLHVDTLIFQIKLLKGTDSQIRKFIM